jgi:predicted ATP-dependent endonuclease of OLD family
MQIAFVEIKNFRKLKSVRVGFADKTTLLVGANNSGKTSAMVALRHFLITKTDFSTNDFTLSNWSAINKLGEGWAAQHGKEGTPPPTMEGWVDLLPTMDVWLTVGSAEIHYVSHLLPTLAWAGGPLGVRLRLEPKKVEDLYAEYVRAVALAEETQAAAKKLAENEGAPEIKLKLWPQSLRDFLDRRLKALFEIKAYTLDPTKCAVPEKGVAQPQTLQNGSEPLEGNPFRGLIRIDEVHAQRGFSDASAGRMQDGNTGKDQRRLSEQLRTYYTRHLDPAELPEVSDLSALQAIDNAQSVFDAKLQVGFGPALKEVESLGYPGVTDPRLIISTRIRPADSLDHDSAVQYEIIAAGDDATAGLLRLPEDYNGLGYQNLISIVFRLMSFRDGWMKVGKASKKRSDEDPEETPFPPLHLVLIEEPEAHLHAQVQQVFIRKAYDILRTHPDLGASTALRTQLVISTHSSHMAHECEFSALRYFRRLPASVKGDVPYSTVINLSEVFGGDDDTKKFVIRYLKAMHCDLFFADAAILVEGAAERMLVPHFIRSKYPKLNQAYITILEINGSHAHRLRKLVDKLGLITLVVTDLDAIAPDTKKAIPISKGAGLLSNNQTLKDWVPKRVLVDELLTLPAKDKEIPHDLFFAIRVAYQLPLQVTVPKSKVLEEVYPTTFEDALVFANIGIFASLEGSGLIAKFKDQLEKSVSATQLGKEMHESLRTGSKAQFALDLLFIEDPAALEVPNYIAEGLSWLQEQIVRKQQETILQTEAAKEAAI